MTHVSVYNETKFADPYKRCNVCGGWITGVLDNDGPAFVMPCGHDQGYSDGCPSWSPVDGCTCAALIGYVPHGQPPK